MEKELLGSLFGDEEADVDGANGDVNDDAAEEELSARTRVGGRGSAGGQVDGVIPAEEVLCKVLQGIARPLQVCIGIWAIYVVSSWEALRCLPCLSMPACFVSSRRFLLPMTASRMEQSL